MSSVCTSVVLGALFPSHATAEEEAVNSGFHVGDGTLHPLVDVQAGYDTAAALDPTGNILGSFVLRVRPALQISVPGPTLSVDFDAGPEVVLYSLQLPNGASLSHLQAAGRLGLGVNNAGPVGVDFAGAFHLFDEHAPTPLAIGTLNNYGEARLGVPIGIDDGKFSVEPAYDFSIASFLPFPIGVSPFTTNNAAVFDYDQHSISVLATLKLVPRTLFLFDGDYVVRDYSLFQDGFSSPNTPTHGFHAQIGAVSLIPLPEPLLGSLSTVAKFGWGADIGTGSLGLLGLNNLIGQVEAAYVPTQSFRASIGFLRTWEPVAGLPRIVTFIDNRPYAEIRVLAGKQFSFHVSGELDVLQYEPATTSRGFDLVANVDPTVEYEVMAWFRVSTTYVFSALLINGSNTTCSASLPCVSYFRNEGFVKLRFLY